MNWHAHKLYPLVTALCLSLPFSGPVFAQDDAGQLETWLSDLAQADEAEALRLSREIERAWSKSGSTALDMLLRRGREALQNEDAATAIDHLSALTDHAPEFAEGYHLRATAYFMTERYGPALGDLQQVIALNPQHYNAIFGLGTIFAELGDYVRAEQAFRMVLGLHPHHAQATQALDALKRQGIGHTL